MDNKTLLEKADLALSDLTTGGGYLLPEQAAKFIQLMIREAVLMKMVKVVPMKSHTKLLEKSRFTSRVLRAGQSATALAAADRSKPTFTKTELNAKLFKAEVDLNDEDLEDNIERGALRDTIMKQMAERISLDIDDILVNGDTALSATDPFLAQFDGILKQATSNLVNAGGATLTKNVLRDVIKAMPLDYLRQRPRMRFMTSVNAEIDYRDSLSDRMTALGDANLVADRPVGYSSVPVIPIPVFPEDQGGGNDETSLIFTDPKQINLGMWRQIRVERDRDIRAGITKIVTTLRMDSVYTEETAVVKATGIKVS